MPNLVNRPRLEAGEYINGRYHIEQLLGEGAFGKVFRVTDGGRGEYALKILKLWDLMPELRRPLIDRFDMEYRTGQIRSDYLVQTLANGMEQGNPFIVMEYCPNGNLKQYAGSKAVDMLRIAREILYGLNDLHKNGKVHRDLKPENVLLKANNTVALTDFGIAGDRNKRMTERGIFGRPQQIFGTYAYMPPEQVNRKRGEATVLPTTDIFSFGVMMYQMLTGKLPFGELNGAAELMLYQSRGKEGKWDRQALSSSAGAGLWEDILEGCLRPDLRHRFQSVRDILRLMPEANSAGHALSSRPYASPGNYPLPYKDDAGQVSGEIASLRVMQGKEFGKCYELGLLMPGHRRFITVGRDPDNGICLADDGHLSRRHCTLEADAGKQRWFVRDGQWIAAGGCWSESTNGTFVGSGQVTEAGAEIFAGDIITVGYTTLRVE
ncbi:MAG: protein kinase [Tannerellaceae bacterium]|jgi:serine/threonine protein kinase|nr:protein kinase [Tannerellaceae bacterium]